jgi:hypothetical protein
MIPTVERLAGGALTTTTRFTTLCTAALAFVIIGWPSLSEAGFGPAASMHFARSGHTATLLPSGKVLVAGGFGELMAGGITTFITLASAELYSLRRGGRLRVKQIPKSLRACRTEIREAGLIARAGGHLRVVHSAPVDAVHSFSRTHPGACSLKLDPALFARNPPARLTDAPERP